VFYYYDPLEEGPDEGITAEPEKIARAIIGNNHNLGLGYRYNFAIFEPCKKGENMDKTLQRNGTLLIGGRYGKKAFGSFAIECLAKDLESGKKEYEWTVDVLSYTRGGDAEFLKECSEISSLLKEAADLYDMYLETHKSSYVLSGSRVERKAGVLACPAPEPRRN